MKAEFIKLYNEELATLRKEGIFFAENHPKIAGRLKLGQGNAEDPLVGRLLESFAFLTANSQYQLQGEVKKLDENLIQLLYPHYFLPFPACSILQLKAAEELETAYSLPKKTAISSSFGRGKPIIFNTVYPTRVRPIQLQEIRYSREMPLQNSKSIVHKSSLSLTLKSNQNLTNLNLDSLRFFINGTSEMSGLLCELLFSNLVEIRFSLGTEKFFMPLSSLKPVGFSEEESLLPYPPNSFSGYRLLTEYFAYPEKFLFFDLNALDTLIKNTETKEIQLNFYFDAYHPELEKLIQPTSLLLHCTPIINLFEKSSESMNWNYQQGTYHVIADFAYDQSCIEVYNILDLSINSLDQKKKIDCAPYFGRKFKQKNQALLYWHLFRKSSQSLGASQIPGDEVFLNISDFNFENKMTDLSFSVKLLCTNRDAPQALPFGGGQPYWDFETSQHSAIASLSCLKKITPSQYRKAQQHNRLQLAKHINLNQIGYADPNDTLDTLKSILSVYSFAQHHENSLIDSGLIEATAQAITLRHPENSRQGFCRGIHYKITLDECFFPDRDAHLFGSILSSFLSKSCSVNSFVILDLISKQRGVLFTWKPQLGKSPIL